MQKPVGGRRILRLATAWVAILCATAQLALGDDHPAGNNMDYGTRVEKAYTAARARYQKDPTSDAAWQFGRACYDWADYATKKSDRATISQEGIDACQKLVAREPNSAPGHYYLGMDFAELARTKMLGALSIVEEMETEFKSVKALDENFDYGGADRNLGLLYRDAPGWPASIGNNAKAKEHLVAALKLAPDYPENALNLIESELTWGDRDDAAREMKKLDETWAAAKAKYTGVEWESSWTDWTTRRIDAKRKIAEVPHPARPGR